MHCSEEILLQFVRPLPKKKKKKCILTYFGFETLSLDWAAKIWFNPRPPKGVLYPLVFLNSFFAQ